MKKQWNCSKQFAVTIILLYKSGIILLGNKLVFLSFFRKTNFFSTNIFFQLHIKLCVGAYVFYFSKLRFIKLLSNYRYPNIVRSTLYF